MAKHKCSVCNEKFKDEYFDEKQNKCILHCEKDGEIHQAKEFLKEITKIVYSNENKYVELKNIVFPAVDTENLNRFKKEKIIFKNCKFQGKITCTDSSIKPTLEFEKCEFDSLILWEDLTIENEISFKDSIFKDDFINNGCTFNKEVDLEGVIYESVADFSGTTFKEVVKQKYTSYDGYAVFRDVIFEKPLNLRDTLFNQKVNLLNISKNEKNEIVDVENRETARIIKDSFEKQNNIIEANKFYALEMKEREKELKWGKDFFEKLIFTLHGISSNHSQDWLLALFWILNISFGIGIMKNNIELFGVNFISFIPSIVIIIFGINIAILENFARIFFTIVFTFLTYGLYGILSHDLNLYCISNTINPFSIMSGKEHLTFGGLIYKITIAYLIYQLIISIRQNTRRK
ncbi:MAG: pentapeptide repeat-containing protein [Candidatus Marinarcus sp.]|uniref:pentapeptide repeat-containing protein n=1 Tax=Candidatus Marinarcus sp. TaxID=3100987 RepID=UPI003B005A58